MTSPYEQFADLLREGARATSRRSRGTTTNAMGSAAEGVFEELEGRLDLLAIAHGEYRRRVEDEARSELGFLFQVLDAATGLLHGTVLELEGQAVKPPHSIEYATIGLANRAVRTSHEMGSLIRSGFASGAQARWRTLSEVRVVLRVLGRGNRHTATRYIEHRWWHFVRDFSNNYASEPWPGPCKSPEALLACLRRRFGPSFDGPYGWAAELTKRKAGVRKPQWKHLLDLAGHDDHRLRHDAAHHAIHADSLGLLTVIERGGSFHSGVDWAPTRESIYETVYMLGEIADAILSLWQEHCPSKRMTALHFLVAEAYLTLGFRAKWGLEAPGRLSGEGV